MTEKSIEALKEGMLGRDMMPVFKKKRSGEEGARYVQMACVLRVWREAWEPYWRVHFVNPGIPPAKVPLHGLPDGQNIQPNDVLVVRADPPFSAQPVPFFTSFERTVMGPWEVVDPEECTDGDAEYLSQAVGFKVAGGGEDVADDT